MIVDRLKRATWMRLDLLDRWLLKELLGPLLFFIALFTLLLLTGGVMFAVSYTHLTLPTNHPV